MSDLLPAHVAKLWDADPGYLNTSSFGLPPRPAFQALTAALADWRHGRTSWEGWAASVDSSRIALAGLLGLDPDLTATGGAVSQMLAPVAAAVPDGATVLVADVEFTSAVFPFAVHTTRGVTVRETPLAGFLDAIDESVDVVVISAVQSAGGELSDVTAICDRAQAVGAVSVCDFTQAAGWLDIDYAAPDVGVLGAYKWLCAPRGTGFCWFRPDLADRHPGFERRLQPLAAGWFAAAEVHQSYYGLPMRLAHTMRRFDISPAWHCWVGTTPALEILTGIGLAAIGRHNLLLANEFLGRLDQPASDSAIVSVPADDAALDRLAAAGVKFGIRAGRARLAFHLYNTLDDVDLAVSALRG